MNLLLAILPLALFSIAFCAFDDDLAVGAKPILMIKAPRSTRIRSFIRGAWTEPQPFRDSPIGKIVSKCKYPKLYDCYSHSDEILEVGIEKAVTKANMFWVNSRGNTERTESYLCVTTWSGFSLECMEDSPQDCIEDLPNNQQQAFMCVNLPREDYLNLFKPCFGIIFSFTRKDGKKNTNFVGGFLNVDDAFPEFSNRTGLMVTLQKTIKGAPNENELRSKILEDSYEHFAEVVGSHVMVRTCSKKLSEIRASFHGLGDPMMFNVEKSFHPMFPGGYNGDECVDNTKLAYSIPINKDRDNYYVCFSDLPRDVDGMISAGGLYCWVDKELNLDLRCNTVPAYLLREAHHNSYVTAYAPAVFEEEEYFEWYSDCPEDVRRPVLEQLKKDFKKAKENLEKTKKETRNFDEL